MIESDFTIIKSRSLVLKNGERSRDVVLADSDGDGDMFFTFELRYVKDSSKGATHSIYKGPNRAEFIIEVKPNAFTQPSDLLEIGTYGIEREPLFLGFVVQPQIGNSGMHNVIITFYTRKKG